jgi:CDK-activating kinase assembly factor MAT1
LLSFFSHLFVSLAGWIRITLPLSLFTVNSPFAMEAENEEDFLLRCAVCGTTEGDASNLSSHTTLQTNATVGCGHMFCNGCIDRELVRRFFCPICKTVVKKGTLKIESLDRVQCDKDTSWRRKILAVYNKTEKDFASLLDYNNYLEEVEDKIYAIVNEEPAAEDIKARFKEYEQAHRAQIVIRQSQRADEERSILDRITSEQRETEQMRHAAIEEERAVAAAKKRFKAETLEVLLGKRDEVSAEVKQAQMQGYRNDLRRQQRGKAVTNFVSPRVREPKDGLPQRDRMDRQLYLKRQAAGGGIPVDSIASQERAWNETVSSLFARV